MKCSKLTKYFNRAIIVWLYAAVCEPLMDLHEGFGYAFVYRCNKHSITSEIALYPRRNRDPSNACSDVIPPFNLDPEKIKAQVLHYGPEIPEGAWSKPCRPPGFCGYRGMASDFRFCKPDSAVMSRMMRRKYKQVIYKHVRTRYKQYIKDARNVSELMYWRAKLDSLPRDSAKSRYKRICMITGRTRSVSRVIGLTRHQFREFANRCLIPGIRRANW